jgi:cytoskeletal protein RodZ
VSIGPTLEQARQEAGLTVTEVSARTRIRETVVRRIEQDDFGPCGGDFYARGHIRSIARVIGIDPEPLVREFDDAHGGVPQPVSAVSVFENERPLPIRERRSPNWTAAMALALVLVLVYGIVQVFDGGGDPQNAKPVSQPSTATPTKTPAGGGPVAEAPRKEVLVRVKAVEASWVNVRDERGRELFSGLVRAGDVREWTAKKRIQLVLGNAGGVRLTVNGKDLGSPGGDGRVERLTFDPGDPEGA